MAKNCRYRVCVILATVVVAAVFGRGSSAFAGPIILAGYDATVISQGYDIQGLTGPTTTVFYYESNVIAQPSVNLSLNHTGSDGIVTISSLASASGVQALSPDGTHATADFSIYGATTATGSLGYRANPWSQMFLEYAFVVKSPTLVTLTFDGQAGLPIVDPDGFNAETDGDAGGPGLSTILNAPSTAHYTNTFLLDGSSASPKEYEYFLNGQSYDVQNPGDPGTYSEFFYEEVHLDLQAVPEPASLPLLVIGGLSCLGAARSRKPCMSKT
jgi:hypothetical protein